MVTPPVVSRRDRSSLAWYAGRWRSMVQTPRPTKMPSRPPGTKGHAAISWFHPLSACARECAPCARSAAGNGGPHRGGLLRAHGWARHVSPHLLRRFAAGLAGGFHPCVCRGRLSARGRPSLSARSGYSSRSKPLCIKNIISRGRGSVKGAAAWLQISMVTGWPSGRKRSRDCAVLPANARSMASRSSLK